MENMKNKIIQLIACSSTDDIYGLDVFGGLWELVYSASYTKREWRFVVASPESEENGI